MSVSIGLSILSRPLSLYLFFSTPLSPSQPLFTQSWPTAVVNDERKWVWAWRQMSLGVQLWPSDSTTFAMLANKGKAAKCILMYWGYWFSGYIHFLALVFQLFVDLLILCVWVFWLPVCICLTCLVWVEARRGPWNWSYSYELPSGCWELNLGPLQSNKCSWPLIHLSSPSALFYKEEIIIK